MQTVATNIRFSPEDYQALRELAFLKKRSIARIVRDAVSQYRLSKTTAIKDRLDLFRLMVKSRIKIDVPTPDLIAEGRKI
ncbi:hypothetical protein HYU91_04565 [Candidatus Collierbacteria bacterium]|nr:hypothetical protein [Candidatus Collierbacteria bacterium]